MYIQQSILTEEKRNDCHVQWALPRYLISLMPWKSREGEKIDFFS